MGWTKQKKQARLFLVCWRFCEKKNLNSFFMKNVVISARNVNFIYFFLWVRSIFDLMTTNFKSGPKGVLRILGMQVIIQGLLNERVLLYSCQSLHCNPLQGKYRFFTGNSLCSISTLTCFGSVQGLKGANFIEIQGNICILYRNIALDSYIHVYVLITGISLLFEKQQHRILEKQGKPCK